MSRSIVVRKAYQEVTSLDKSLNTLLSSVESRGILYLAHENGTTYLDTGVISISQEDKNGEEFEGTLASMDEEGLFVWRGTYYRPPILKKSFWPWGKPTEIQAGVRGEGRIAIPLERGNTLVSYETLFRVDKTGLPSYNECTEEGPFMGDLVPNVHITLPNGSDYGLFGNPAQAVLVKVHSLFFTPEETEESLARIRSGIEAAKRKQQKASTRGTT